jgi:hypothetical protein
VLVKVTPDLSDLLVGHTTWWTYTAMTRIYKHYSFALLGSQIKAHMTSMSSYPGMVTSMVSGTHTRSLLRCSSQPPDRMPPDTSRCCCGSAVLHTAVACSVQ